MFSTIRLSVAFRDFFICAKCECLPYLLVFRACPQHFHSEYLDKSDDLFATFSPRAAARPAPRAPRTACCFLPHAASPNTFTFKTRQQLCPRSAVATNKAYSIAVWSSTSRIGTDDYQIKHIIINYIHTTLVLASRQFRAKDITDTCKNFLSTSVIGGSIPFFILCISKNQISSGLQVVLYGWVGYMCC